ncbi:MAG: allene oxide cyclase family protein [Steroidobacteraceae bacterium]
MNHKSRGLIAVLGLLSNVLALPALAAERIEVVEHADTDATLDLGAKGDSVGDLLTWSNLLFDASNKTRVGSDQGYCVRVSVGKSWECSWTNMLKDGQIMVEGPFWDDKDSLLTIIGGTGKYVGAKGTLKLHARDAKASSYQFVFELL